MEHRKFNADESLKTVPLSDADLEKIRARRKAEAKDTKVIDLDENDIEIIGEIGKEDVVELQDSDIEEIIEELDELDENDILPSTPPPLPGEALRVTSESSKNSPIATGRGNAQDFPVTDEERAAYEATHNPINRVVTAPERGIRARQMATERGDAAAQKRAVAAHTEKNRAFYNQTGAQVDIGKQKAFQTAEKGDVNDLANQKEYTPALIKQMFGIEINTDGSPAGLPFGSNRRRFNKLMLDNPDFFATIKRIQTPQAEMRTVKKDGFLKKVALWAGLSAGAAGATAAGATFAKHEAYTQGNNEPQIAAALGSMSDLRNQADIVQEDVDSGVQEKVFGATETTSQEKSTAQIRKTQVEKKGQVADDQIKIGDTIAFPTTGEKKIVRQPGGRTIESTTVPGPGGTSDMYLTIQKPGEPIQFQRIVLAQDGTIDKLYNLDHTGKKVVGSVEYSGGGVKTEGNGNAKDIFIADVDMRLEGTSFDNKSADDARATLDQMKPASNKK